MADLGGTFDATTVKERGFEPLVPGQYVAMITDSELKETKSGGKMIELKIEVQDGPDAGHTLTERLNIENSNPKAVDFAFRTLGEIVRALGKTTVKKTEELHNKRFLINVVVKPAEPYIDKDGNEKEGSPQNDINKYLPYSGTAPATVTVQKEATATAAGSDKAASGSVPPWKRKA